MALIDDRTSAADLSMLQICHALRFSEVFSLFHLLLAEELLRHCRLQIVYSRTLLRGLCYPRETLVIHVVFLLT